MRSSLLPSTRCRNRFPAKTALEFSRMVSNCSDLMPINRTIRRIRATTKNRSVSQVTLVCLFFNLMENLTFDHISFIHRWLGNIAQNSQTASAGMLKQAT